MNLGRLETRLDCIELAKEQDTGERCLYTVQGSMGEVRYKGKLSHPIREICSDQGESCPTRNQKREVEQYCKSRMVLWTNMQSSSGI